MGPAGTAISTAAFAAARGITGLAATTPATSLATTTLTSSTLGTALPAEPLTSIAAASCATLASDANVTAPPPPHGAANLTA